ncbi:MAG: hypothetical protein BZY88_04550 [SAR202 cluster bacterium Io17-Chloro-G9]|nr:MAG: hypothetical protein BZY88_04550 [SAR202 cluster bacterium Io17-Chloro-G9]
MPSFWDKLQVDGQDMNLYASIPGGSGPFPAVVVIQAAGGVNDFITKVSDSLAEGGYVAVAPDLFHRMTDDSVTDGITKAGQLSDPEIITDVNAAVDFLRNHSAVDGERIGVTGFCMGGRVTWLAAATNPHFKAAVPYYGGNLMVPRGGADQSPFQLTNGINCPILFHFGEVDANPSQDDMRTLDDELTRLGKPHKFFTYPGADHAFMDHTGARYHKESAETSWPRTLEFFAAHLKGVPVR